MGDILDALSHNGRLALEVKSELYGIAHHMDSFFTPEIPTALRAIADDIWSSHDELQRAYSEELNGSLQKSREMTGLVVAVALKQATESL